MQTLPASLWSTRPRTSTISSGASTPSAAASAFSKTTTSTVPSRSSTRGEHHRRAAAGADLLGLGDHAADLHPLAVLALGDLGDAQSAFTRSASRTRLSGCSVMKTPIDSFSIASSSGRSNSCVGIGGCDGAANALAPAAVVAEAAEVEDRALADLRRPAGPSGRRPARPPAPRACRARVAPVEPKAPHLISASIARLLTVRQSTRSQKSHSDVNGPVLLAGALDRLHRGVADALHGVQAEADVAVDDHELVVGLVDVRRQDLDPHALRLVDEERHLVLGVHHRGDQRGHVLGRVVGLQPRRPVGDQRVAGGVGLVERVVGRLLVGRPQRLDHVVGACPTPGSPRRTRA